MPLEALIHHYGYIALFIACFIQSDTLLIIAGIYARNNTLSIYWVIICAVIAGFAGDLLCYCVGSLLDIKILQHYPKIEARSQRVAHYLKRFDILFMVLVRFMYGLRILGPIMLGMSHIKLGRFLLFNFIGALIWATFFALLGYLFGELIFSFIKYYRSYLLDVMVLVGAVVLAYYYYYFHLRKSS